MKSMKLPYALLWEPLVAAALREDLGRAGDVTTEATVPADAVASADLVARSEGRLAGIELAAAAFRALDPSLAIDLRAADGDDVAAGQVLLRVSGAARPILSAERVALNFVGHLSGIATATRSLVRAIGEAPAKVVSTRKTTPGLRLLEKHAVRAGGGSAHRYGLDDGILIKDNHRAIAGGVAAAVERARAAAGHMVKVEVEVDTLAELDVALRLPIDAVLLDNMGPETLREAVRRVDAAAAARGGARVITEASGGITLETAPAIAASGVDLLSVGWLTHSAPSLDVALDIA